VALLELADALLPAEFGEAEAMASLDAVGVARPPMWRVGAGWEELLEWVGSRGWQQPVQQVRELLAQVRDGLVTEDDEMLLRRLVERLSGQSAYLAEKVDGRNWEMERVDGLLTPSVLLGHLQGGSRVGTYLADDDGRVRQLVFRVAGERGQVVPPWAPHFGREPEDAARWAAQLADVQTVAVQVGRVMHELALWPWIEEDSGGQRTLRCLLDEPQPVAVARMLVRRVLDEVMVVPQGVKLVPTPTEDRLGKRGGPWSYVPAGSCSRTGGRVKRLDVDGREVRLDWRALVQHPGVSAEVVQRVVHGGGRSSIVAGADVLTGELVETGRGELDKVLAGCGVLRAWYWKAQRLRHLDSTEKQTIFEVLGHLGQGVRMPAMLEILGPAGVTEGDLQQRLRRLPSMPIACRTVRERFAAMGQSAPCERCEFGRLPRGAYPTPVLWAVGVDELPGVKQKVEQVAGRPGSRGQAKEVPVVRRRTTGESSPGRSSASSAAPVQPAAAPVMVKPAPAPLPVTAPSSADRVLSPEPRTQKSSASEPTVMEEFASALEQMTRVKEQIRNAERGLEKVEARLNALFDRLETEEVELPMGRLVRVSRQPAQFQLLL
jgi:hypothetical protein